MSMEQKYKVRVLKVKDILKWKTNNYFLYFNYDNEAFMNTGIQESGSTPFGASTTTGPAGKAIPGKVGMKQDIIEKSLRCMIMILQRWRGWKIRSTLKLQVQLNFISNLVMLVSIPGL